MMSNKFEEASKLADKYGITIESIGHKYEKHPRSGNDYEVYTIKLSRKEKSFTVKFGVADIGIDDDVYINPREIHYKVFDRLPKYDLGTFDEFLENIGSDRNEEDIKEEKRCYEFECDLYDNTMMLFSDIIEEIRDLEYE